MQQPKRRCWNCSAPVVMHAGGYCDLACREAYRQWLAEVGRP